MDMLIILLRESGPFLLSCWYGCRRITVQPKLAGFTESTLWDDPGKFNFYEQLYRSVVLEKRFFKCEESMKFFILVVLSNLHRDGSSKIITTI